jgi:hypothetical protein
MNEIGQSLHDDQADQDQQHDERKQTGPHCPQPNGQTLHLLGNEASP